MDTLTLDRYLKKYADLIISIGVNVQPGQDVIIYAAIDQQKLAHLVLDAAYQKGATQVQIEWNDQYLTHELIKHSDPDKLSIVPTSTTIRAKEIADKHTARISIISEDPDALGDLNQNDVANYSKALAYAKKPVMDATMNNDLSWVVVAASSPKWAHKVFPDVNLSEAVDQLWNKIFEFNRITLENDPVVAWQQHIKKLSTKAAWLNQENFKEIHFTSNQTDLTVGLAQDHVWEGADSFDKSGNYFTANLPTEEVFTAPDYRNIHGVVKATKPLSYGGVLINDIELTFVDGQVTKATASSGEDVLQHLIQSDDGAKSLGEVSLVPNPSPISQSGIIFYNTLIDENASNHLALGAAYPFNINNGTQMSDEQRQNKGENLSIIHVDFMMGSADMNVVGIKYDGTITPIFENGDWI